MRALLKNYKFSVPSAVALLALISWLAFGYFGIHKLFVDDRVSEAAPVFGSSAATTTTVTPDTAVTTAPAGEVTTEASGVFVSREHDTSGTATVLGNGTGQRFLRFEDFNTSNGPDVNVYLVNSSTGDVSDYIDLGDLKGNIGDQNYDIPSTVDLETYDTVVIWCARFSVAFGDAELQAA